MELDFFTNYILPPMIIIIGLIGNTLDLIVASKKELKKTSKYKIQTHV